MTLIILYQTVMRKYYPLILSLVTVGLLFSSCQKEEPETSVNGEVDFSISAGIPSGLTTYAQPELQSHLGGANNLDKEVYDLRYILEVWTDEATPQLAYKEIITEDNFGGVTFKARLLAKKYNFVFWADFVNEGGEDNLVYNADELTAITYADLTDRRAGQDLADAYYAVVPVDLTTAGQTMKQVTLKRPFGKIRLIATDQLSGNLQTERPSSTEVVYGNYNVPTTFNALTKEASGSAAAGSYIFTPQTEEYVLNGTAQNKTGYVLGYDYIFSSDEVPSYAFNVTVKSESGQIGYRELSNIPVAENKLTTVIGNFYTNEGALDVIVEDPFDNEESFDVPESTTVNSSAALQDAIDAAADGDIIIIAPGTYGAFTPAQSTQSQNYFQLPTDKNLIFRGANAGIDPNTGTRGEETVVTIPFTYAHTTKTTADFTFDGLTFTEQGQISVGKESGANLTFTNNIVKDQTRTVDANNAFFATPYTYGASFTMGDIVVENNLLDGAGLGTTNSCGFRMWGIANATFKNNVFKNFTHSAAQFDNVSGDLNLDGNSFENCDNYKFRVQVINIDGERNYGSNEGDVTEKGFFKIERTGTGYDSFADVLAAAQANDVILIAEGEYGLNQDITSAAGNNQEFYLPIETQGLTLKGKGSAENTIVYGSEVTANGAWGTQTTLIIFAEDVTISNLTLMPKQEANKLIEIRANGFELSDCIVVPNSIVDGASLTDAASVYFAEDVTSGTIRNNKFEYGNIAFDGIMDGTFTIEGNTFDKFNQLENTLYPTFTCSYWGSGKEVYKSKMVVNIKNNTFTNVEPLGATNDIPVVRASYGIFNLDGNSFPTDGVYWKSAPGTNIPNSFGAVYVDYNSVIDRVWGNDPDPETGSPYYGLPQSFAISNDMVELETTTSKRWQGYTAKTVGMQTSSYWEIASTLTLTGDDQQVSKCISLYLDYEYVEFRFVQDVNGNRSWQYWMPSTAYDGDGEYMKISDELGIPTEKGEYEIKITFNGGIITHLINGKEVGSYNLGEKKTKIGTVSLISYGYDQSYKTTWSYPVVRY